MGWNERQNLSLESEQFGWAVRCSRKHFAGVDQIGRGGHGSSEVGGIEFVSKDCLMHGSKLGDGEGFSEEGVGDFGVFHLGAKVVLVHI